MHSPQCLERTEFSMFAKPVGNEKSKVMVIADYFYPRYLPPEAELNTQFVQELQTRAPVLLWADSNSQLPSKNLNCTIMGRASYWGIKTLARICLCARREKPSKMILMYDGGAYSGSMWISLLPALIKAMKLDTQFITHFTSEAPVPLSPTLKRILRKLSWPNVSFFNESIGFLAASDTLLFYCKHHRSALTSPRSKLSRKTELVEVPMKSNHEKFSKQELNAFRKKIGIRKNTPIVCFLGLLYPDKGVETLLHASDLIKKKGVYHNLILIGGSGGITALPSWNEKCDRYKSDLIAYTKTLGIESHCLWMESISKNELSLTLAISDLAVLPFRRGVMANNSSFATCLAHELPVITTKTDYTDTFIRESDAVILVPPQAPEKLALEIEGVLADSAKRAALKEAIREFMSNHFSWDNFLNKILAS